jgi:hypothetical protein
MSDSYKRSHTFFMPSFIFLQFKITFQSMKKRFHITPSHGLMLVALVAVAALFSSFTIAAKSAGVQTLSQEAMSAIQNYSFHKLNFWQKAALTTAAFGASAYAVRRFQRRHGGGLGCLGVLGAVILGIVIIALFPILLLVGLFMLIFGIPIRWGRREYYRGRGYEGRGRRERRGHHGHHHRH